MLGACFSHSTATDVVVNCVEKRKKRKILYAMASMNYCFTLCRAAEEKVQHEHQSANIDVPQSGSPGTGAYFFGRFFSFGTTPPLSAASMSNPFVIKAFDSKDDDH